MKSLLVFIYVLVATVSVISHGEIRAIIDMGSGSTKMKVYSFASAANVNEIKKCKAEKSIAVKESIQNELIDGATELLIISAVKELKEQALSCGATKFVAVATAAYREAKNGGSILTKVAQEAGIQTNLATWEEEAMLGFAGVDHLLNDHQDKCVWDIGGGSLQIVCRVDNNYTIDLSDIASVKFKNLVIDLQRPWPYKKYKRPNTPNPVQIKTLKIDLFTSSLNKLKSNFKNANHLAHLPVYGIGGVHKFSAFIPLKAKTSGTYGTSDLDELIQAWSKLTDEDLVNQNIVSAPFASTHVSNTLLIKTVMELFKIPKVTFVDSGLFEGILFTEKYWSTR
jgi:exopolyphosphatase/guanosine-5'-triphosphate,3'-diphosphate pyrophosphatase